MHNFDVLLIQLYGPMQPPNAEPLSIEVIAGATREQFPEAEIVLETVSARNKNDIKRVVERITNSPPMIIGISVPQSTLDIAIALSNEIYQSMPDAHIVLGHALPTYSYEIFLGMFPQCVIVRGWGEESFCDLIRYYSCKSKSALLKEIPNLCYMNEGELCINQICWPQKIYSPLRLDQSLYYTRVETSRGCHHDVCTFCTRPVRAAGMKDKWTRRPIKDILKEVKQLRDAGVKYFTFTDEDFVGSDLAGAQEIAYQIAQLDGINFSLSIRADNIYNSQNTFAEKEQRRHLFQLLQEAGLYLVFVGIESLSDSQLFRYGKGLNAKDSITAVHLLQQLGVEIELGFILFDPLLTRDELLENIQRLDESGLWEHTGCIINPLRSQKGSAYTRMLVRAERVKEFDPNTMAYQTSFADPVIGDIKVVCRNWLDEFEQIYVLVRNIQRTSESAGIYTRFLFSSHSLLFRYLRKVVDVRLVKSQFLGREDLLSLNNEREGLVRCLYRYLQNKLTLNITEEVLKRECDLFLKYVRI